MNYILVILGVILVIAIYFLYLYLTNDNLSSGIQDLTQQIITPSKKLKSPGSKVFSYQFWIFLSAPATTEGGTPILSRNNGGTDTNFNISIDGTQLKIKNGSTTLFTATNSFPIQKWTFVVVNYNDSNKLAECYINGKLVYTQQVTSSINVVSSDQLTIGASTTKGYITKVVYLPETLSSDTVWSKYLEGNGQLSISSFFAGYNLNMAVSKDDVVQKNWKLFA